MMRTALHLALFTAVTACAACGEGASSCPTVVIEVSLVDIVTDEPIPDATLSLVAAANGVPIDGSCQVVGDGAYVCSIDGVSAADDVTANVTVNALNHELARTDVVFVDDGEGCLEAAAPIRLSLTPT